MEDLETTLSAPEQKKTLPFSQFALNEKVTFLLGIIRSALPLIVSFECFPIANIVNLLWIRDYENSDALVGAFGLGYIWTCFWVGSLMFGLNQGINVLVSHAFGAQKMRLCGIYLQRGIVILFSIISPFFLVLWFSEDVMLFLGVDPVLANKTKDYTRYIIFSQIGAGLFDCMKAFIVAQKVFDPIVYIQIATITLHFFWSFLFIYVFRLGVTGAALCRICEDWTNCLLLYIYIKRSGKFEQTFIPWSEEATNKDAILKQIKFTLPIAGVTYFEFIYFEFMMIIAGMFGTQQTVAHLSTSQTSNLNFLCYLGISITAMSLIGNALGERDIEKAKNYFKGCLYISLGLCFITGFFLRIYRHSWIRMWTDNPEIIEIILSTLLIYQLGLMPLDALMNSLLALLKATEKQDMVNKWTLIGLYCVGCPLTIIICFLLDYRVPGLWFAFFIAYALITAVFIKEAFKINWNTVVETIHARLKDHNNDLELIEGSEMVELYHEEKIEKS